MKVGVGWHNANGWQYRAAGCCWSGETLRYMTSFSSHSFLGHVCLCFADLTWPSRNFLIFVITSHGYNFEDIEACLSILIVGNLSQCLCILKVYIMLPSRQSYCHDDCFLGGEPILPFRCLDFMSGYAGCTHKNHRPMHNGQSMVTLGHPSATIAGS